jgi:predicted nucleic acid-binding protein
LSDRVFLDANVLVSAAWLPKNSLLTLWELVETELLTSAYAIAEADRNVRTPDQRTRLHRLVQRVRIVDEPRIQTLPATVRLPAKDAPILLAAIETGADYLVTGDLEHFGPYFGQSVGGVHILRPRDYLARRQAP